MPRSSMLAILILVAAVPAVGGEMPPVHIPTEGDLPAFISTYNLFKDSAAQTPNDGVVPYDLNTPHFADYATLHRFVWVPEGTAIRYSDTDIFEYPIGAAVVLTVSYLNDIRDASLGMQLVETRVFIHRTDGWASGQYVWNDDATEAQLALAGGKRDVSWIHYDGSQRDLTVRVPNRVQCKMCHEIDGEFVPLGPMKARYLNKDYPYSGGTANQLSHWARMGFLEGAPDNPDDAPRAAVWNDPNTGTLNDRARSYLDTNCASCHSPGGLAYTSGLNFSYSTTHPTGYGVYKAPIAAGRGGSARFGIIPGDPEGSIVIRRLRSTDPGVRMPVVGRGVVHEEGLALIEDWIAQMRFPELAAAQREQDEIREAQERIVQLYEAETDLSNDAD